MDPRERNAVPSDLESLASTGEGHAMVIVEIEIKTVAQEGRPYQLMVVNDISFILTKERQETRNMFQE